MPRPRPLTYRELRRRLRRFGVTEMPTWHGKGSERMFIRRNPGTGKGPKYSVACHGEGTLIGIGAIKACLDIFSIDVELFWADLGPQ